jgi:hypothetical protein
MSAMRDLLRQSREILAAELGGTQDADAVVRRKVRQMGQTGDLALIGRIIDELAKSYGDALLSEIPDREIGLSRGALIGLRNLWNRLLLLGENPEEASQPTTEPNIYATLADLDG